MQEKCQACKPQRTPPAIKNIVELIVFGSTHALKSHANQVKIVPAQKVVPATNVNVSILSWANVGSKQIK